jgi:hypothetical protein
MIHPRFTQITELTGAVTANGTAEDPRAYAEKVAPRFFPNMLPYTVGTPGAFGFVEWNGRSLTKMARMAWFSWPRRRPLAGSVDKRPICGKEFG